MIRNKVQVHLIKPYSPVKRVGTTKVPTRIISGPGINQFKMRYRIDEVKQQLLSSKAKSIEHAIRQVSKMNLKNISTAFYYNNTGEEYLIFQNGQFINHE